MKAFPEANSTIIRGISWRLAGMMKGVPATRYGKTTVASTWRETKLWSPRLPRLAVAMRL